ncbi:MAG: hypothetical protein KDA44_11000 [Planctomycetales bacterium]|nr:hypothetical protein [Planctomycetales bacterium]
MRETIVRVVKIGGSLFDLPDLPERLWKWMAVQSPAHHVLVAGGGKLVNVVREWDRQKTLDDAAAHWMCVDLLTVTAHFLHDRLPEIPLVEDDRLLCQRVGQQGATIFGPARWMRHSEPALPGVWLPSSWSTTSDAIAGRLAVALRAQEFVLMKSTLPPRRMAWELSALAAAEYIDPILAQMAPDLPPTWFVNLRKDPPETGRVVRPGGGA